MGLVEYLEKSEDRRAHKGKYKAPHLHNLLVRDLASRLPTIGLPDGARIFQEVELQSEHKAQMTGRADLVALAGDELYIVEAKVVMTGEPRIDHNTRSYANQQLRRSHEFFKEEFGVSARCFVAYRVDPRNAIFHYELDVDGGGIVKPKVLEFLEANQNFSATESPNHQRLTDLIAGKTEALGIPRGHQIFVDVLLRQDGHPLGKADIIAWSGDEVHIVATKSVEGTPSGIDRVKQKINPYLRREREFFELFYGMRTKGIGAYNIGKAIYTYVPGSKSQPLDL